LKRAGFFAVFALAACAPAAERAAAPAEPIPLRNAGFEAPARPGERCPVEWGCTMHADPDSFRFTLDSAQPAEGKQSLCIERVTPEPWAIAAQSVQARPLRGRKLRFSIAIRGERLSGAGAGPWVLVNGAQGLLMNEERPERVGGQWQRRSIEFVMPAQAEFLEVGATLLGAGRACIDDVRLEAA